MDTLSYHCKTGNLQFVKKNITNYSNEDISKAIEVCCMYNQTDILLYIMLNNNRLYSSRLIDIAIENDNIDTYTVLLGLIKTSDYNETIKYAFQKASYYGKREFVKEVCELIPTNTIILNEICFDTFKISCRNGKHILCCQYIYNKFPSISLRFIEEEVIDEFKNIISFLITQNKIELVKWLEKLNPALQLSIVIIEHQISIEKTNCVICYNTSDILTNCGHQYCMCCIYRIHPQCSYCRQIINKVIKI